MTFGICAMLLLIAYGLSLLAFRRKELVVR
jgi:hypothetical protein